jgi:DNA-binding XRE family transcriptional regulator
VRLMGEVIPLESRRRVGGSHRGGDHDDERTGARPAPARSPVDPAPAPEPLWREAVGRGLRDLRRARGDRLTDTAERAGMSPQYLSEVERGRKDPSSEMLAAVAGALGVPVREVVRRAHADLALGARTRGGPVMLAA